MWRIILHTVLLFSITACAGPQFSVSDKYTNKLTEIPGIFGLKFFEQGSPECFKFSIVQGRLLLTKDLPYFQHHFNVGPFIYVRNDIPEGLIRIEKYRYYGRYEYSHNNKYIIVSLSLEENHYPRPINFVLINFDSKKVLFESNNTNDYTIEDVIWSPDSSMIAVLYKQSNYKKYGIQDSLLYMANHPNYESSFYLSIYNFSGDILLHARVASGVTNGGGQLLWEKE